MLQMGDQQFSQQPTNINLEASLNKVENQNPKVGNINNESLNNDSSMLTMLHAGYFRICVSLSAQALLWKTLSKHNHESHVFHHFFRMFPSTAYLLLWWLALCTLIALSILYIVRCIIKFKMVKAEFSHHVGVNYLFSPSISFLLLLLSTPFPISKTLTYQILWWMTMVPIIILDLKVYGQWFTTEKKFLSMFANPMSQISVIGNLVGAWVAAEMGYKESAICIFTLGATHYLVVFITLYQRLSGARSLPAKMRPVFFLFVAAPSMGSLAWSSINGGFDSPCKMLFFLSLFLFTSLACRPAIFRKSMKKFTVAWWAYSFPITFLALASIEYSQQVKGIMAATLMLVLSVFAVLVFLALLMFSTLNTDTLLHERPGFLPL